MHICTIDCEYYIYIYSSLAKKGPWVVYLTFGSNMGAGQHSSYQYRVLLSTRWALFQICFRPQQEIEAKPGDGRTIHSGPSFVRL